MKSVFKGQMPTVGIRPAIDGRQMGVRESLERQTMAMAKATAALASSSLRHPDGSPVECVIADTTIGGVAEAAACAEKFRLANVGVSLTVTPCWCYGAETMDMDPKLPKAVWGFNGTERPGAVYLAAVLAAHSQKGLPAFGIYGAEVQDRHDATIPEDVKEKLLRFVRAGLAAAYMRGRSYLGIGGVSMGIAGSILDQSFFEKYLGMRVESVDMSEVSRRLQLKIYDPDEFNVAGAWVKAHCKMGRDVNDPQKQRSAAQKEQEWDVCIAMALICRDLMTGNPRLAALGWPEEAMGRNALAAGFQGQRHWTDFMPNGDFLETILNSSFDWNGPRTPYVVATENDSLNGAAMLLGYLLTARAQIFSDVRTYWSPDAITRVSGWKPDGVAGQGLIHLINSGASCLDGTGEMTVEGKPGIKRFWETTEEDRKRCLEAARFCPAALEYFRGGGFSIDFTTRGGMPVTMSRLNLVDGLGPVLQIAEGVTATLPPHVHDALDMRTNPTWPTTWFAPRLTGQGPFRSVYAVMAAWGANHGAVSYGHVGTDLMTLASMLRIPVSMHNVEEERIFRPSAWASFGMDMEGADYRACRNYGPLYR